MELVDADSESPTLISNVEVMQLLQKHLETRSIANASSANTNTKKKNANKRNNKHFRHRDWIEEEVYKYLQGTPCVKLDPNKRKEFHAKLKANKKMCRSTTTSSETPVATTATVKQEEGTSDNNSHSNNEEKKENSTAALSSAATATATTTGFGLTEAEALQIMNMMPTQPVEIHLMVDELQSRMTEERQEEFLEFISSYCKADDDDDDDDDDDNDYDDGCGSNYSTDEAYAKGRPHQNSNVTSHVNRGENGLNHNLENGKKRPAAIVKKEKDKDANPTGII